MGAATQSPHTMPGNGSTAVVDRTSRTGRGAVGMLAIVLLLGCSLYTLVYAPTSDEQAAALAFVGKEATDSLPAADAAALQLKWRGVDCLGEAVVSREEATVWLPCATNASQIRVNATSAPVSTTDSAILSDGDTASIEDNTTVASPVEKQALCGLRHDRAAAFNESHQCLMWRSVRFDRNLTRAALDAHFTRLQSRFANCSFGNAADSALLGQTPEGQWHLRLSPKCGNLGLLQLSGIDLAAILHATSTNGTRTIVVSGDSMMRQLFLRIVFLLRQRQPVIEFHGWFDITYHVYSDGDELQYRPPTKVIAKKVKVPYEPPLRCVVDDPVRPCLFQMQFLWEPHDNAFDRNLLLRNHRAPELYATGEPAVGPACHGLQVASKDGTKVFVPLPLLPAVHVHAAMYWFAEQIGRNRKTKTTTDARRIIAFFEQIAFASRFPVVDVSRCPRSPTNNFNNSNVAKNNASLKVNPTLPPEPTPLGYHFFYVLTPNFRRSNPEAVHILNLAIRKRNGASAMAVLRGSSNTLQWKKWPELDYNTSSLLALNFPTMLSPMPLQEQLLRSKDSKHFMCTFLPPYPRKIESFAGDDRRCRDEVNAALATWLAAMLVALRR